MYQFSRSIYRELAADVTGEDPRQVARNRVDLLGLCEAAMERLATDRYHFANPTRTLFNDIRGFFSLRDQQRVFRVVESRVRIATDYVEQRARAGVTFDGSPRRCEASTRKGRACTRVPLPDSNYCPSHQHLADDGEPAVAA